MTNSLGSCTDSTAFSPGGNSIESSGELAAKRRSRVVGQVDAGAPENLAVIFDLGQRVGIVRGDPAHAAGSP